MLDVPPDSSPVPTPTRLLTPCALALVLAGCGGGGGGGKGTSSPGPGPDVPTDERQAAIRQTEQKYRELEAQNVDGDAFDAAMKAAMQANPAYKAVTVDADSHTVAGMFADGRVHMVVHNLDLPKTAPTALQAARSVYLPGAKQARVFHAFGSYQDTQEPVTDIAGWLRTAGYNVIGGNGDARLSSLRNVQGDGFFYINTHGGQADFKDKGAEVYGLWSSTPANAQNEAQADVQADLRESRLAYMTAATGFEEPEVETRYAITPAFVRKYWSFSNDSVVWLNACNSGDTRLGNGAQRLVDVLHEKNAGVVFGWSRVLGLEAAFNSARYFADRLLGANEYKPETPKQRPFDWQAVYADMKAKGHAHDSHAGADLIAFPNPKAHTPVGLTPSIERMLVDETQGHLTLLGGFGEKPGRVTIDGVPAAPVSWAKDRVEVVLPLTGKGSYGPVQAESDDRKSNKRNLTQWSFSAPFKYVKLGFTGLQVTGPLQLRFRGDVGEYRLKPGEKPQSHILWAQPTRDSHLPLEATGSVSVGGDSTITWSGKRDYTNPIAGDSSTILLVRLKIDPDKRTGQLGLAMGIDSQADGFVETLSGGGGTVRNNFVAPFGLLDGPKPFEDPMEGGNVPTIPIPALSISFANDWTLHTRTFADTMGMSLTIPTTAPQAPPTWEQPRLAP